MTSLLEAMADARTMPRPASAPPARPFASEAGLRLAMQLRDAPAQSGARVLLFVPAGRNGDASPAVGDAVSAFLDVQEGPLLIVDLRAESFAGSTPAWFDALPNVERTELNHKAGLALDTACISRPLLRRAGKAPYSTTPRFDAQLTEARSQYRYVVYIGDPLPSRDTLMAAAAADGVVLSVAPGRTTRTELHDVAAQLRRAHGKLLGFVVDPRAAQRGSGK